MAGDYQEPLTNDEGRLARFSQLLGVRADATPGEIRAAYRTLAFRLHPDRNKEDPVEAHRRFLEASEAFAALLERRTGASAAPPATPSCGRERSAWDWSQLRNLQPPIWADRGPEEEAAHSPSPGGSKPETLERRRARVRALARELVPEEGWGRWSDALLRGLGAMAGLLAIASVLAALFAVIGREAGIGLALLLGLLSAVAFAWARALREGRIESYEGYAEEILDRRDARLDRAGRPTGPL